MEVSAVAFASLVALAGLAGCCAKSNCAYAHKNGGYDQAFLDVHDVCHFELSE